MAAGEPVAHWLVCLALLWVGFLPVSAQGLAQGEVPGLLSLYRLGLKQDPQLQAARAARRAGLERLPQARADLLPTIALAAEYGRVERRTSEIENVIPEQKKDFNRERYQARLSQPLLDLPAWFRFQASDAQALQADAAYHRAYQDFHERLVTRYIAVLRAQSTLATRQAERAALEKQRTQVRRQLEAGTASRVDVQDVNSEYRRVVVETIRARGGVDQALRRLEEVTGQPLQVVRRLQPHFKLSVPDQNLTGWQRRARADNFRLREAWLSVQVAEHQAKAATAEHLPEVSLNISTQREVSGGAGGTLASNAELTTDTTSLTLRLDMPLFTGGRTSSQRREAAYRLDQAREEYRQALQEVRSSVQAQFQQLQVQRQAIDAARQALAAQKTAVNAAQQGYQAGIRDLVDLVRARRERFAAQDLLNEARFDYLLAWVRLKRLSGALNEVAIRELDQEVLAP